MSPDATVVALSSPPPPNPPSVTWPLATPHNTSSWCALEEMYSKGVFPTTQPSCISNGDFMRPPNHPEEDARRRALYRYAILKSTLPRDAFDHLTHLTQRLFKTAMCAISLVDDTYQWFASEVGLGCSSTTKDVSFCGHAILATPESPETCFVVLDATQDWRFRENPLVKGAPHIRFYAGSKLMDPDTGLPLGTLCIIDDKVWEEFTPEHHRLLLDLSKLVLRELRLWREERWSELKEEMQDAVAEFTQKTVARRDAPSESEGFRIAVDTVRKVLNADLVALVRVREANETLDEGDSDEETLAMTETPPMVHHALDVSTEVLVPVREEEEVVRTLEEENARGDAMAVPAMRKACSHRGSIGEAWSMDFLEPACRSPEGVIWQDELASEGRKPELPPILKHIDGIRSGIGVPVYRVLGAKQYTVTGARKESGIDDAGNQRPFAVLCAFFRDARRVIEDSDRRFLQNFAVSLTALAQRGRVELANRSKSSFVNSISHELRTPLHGILAVVELLEDTRLSSSQRQFLRTIESCGRSLVSVVNHVLDLAKIEYGRMEVLGRPAPVDVWEVCQEVCDAMSPTVRDGIRFNLRVFGGYEGSRWCISDNGSLRQILINLVGNALKFTKQGSVSLEVDIPQDTGECDPSIAELGCRMITFRVIDTGPGMSKSFQTRLCQPFSQENNLSNGTGLGLAITRYLVQAMRGEFSVMSELGQGSTFTVKIPVHLLEPADREREHALAQSVERQVVGHLMGKKIAVFVHAEPNDSVHDAMDRVGLKQLVDVLVSNMNDFVMNPHLCGKWGPEYKYDIIGVVEDPAALRRALRVPDARIVAVAGIGTYDELARIREEATLRHQLSRRFGSRNLSRVGSQEEAPSNADSDETDYAMDANQPARCAIIAHPVGPARVLEALIEVFKLNESKSFVTIEDEEDMLTSIQEAEKATMMRLMMQTCEAETQTEPAVDPQEMTPQNRHVACAASPVAQPVAPSSVTRMPKITQKVITNPGHQVVIETTISFDEEQQQESPTTVQGTVIPTTYQPSLMEKMASPPKVEILPPTPLTAIPPPSVLTPPVRSLSTRVKPDITNGATSPRLNPKPTSSQAISPKHGAPTASPPTVAPPLSVLVVEDNRVNRDILLAFLKRRQIPCDMAENGLQAVQAYQRHGRYDVILMDIQMPVMDGNEATIKIREIEAAAGEPNPCCIWALTGLASTDDEALIRRSGANEILTKPVSLKRLGGMFDTLAKNRKS